IGALFREIFDLYHVNYCSKISAQPTLCRQLCRLKGIKKEQTLRTRPFCTELPVLMTVLVL
ncbi:hypothetical protein, partial [Vibrio parahaemolyticus]|uniref:hypothetical protein n=1 Tax=Vibrio parahaemolyticus TaxID=670 RepID=UPI001C5DC505